MGERQDLNLRLLGPQPSTLPTELHSPLENISPRRIERRTLRVSSVRSNQLSYGLTKVNKLNKVLSYNLN